MADETELRQVLKSVIRQTKLATSELQDLKNRMDNFEKGSDGRPTSKQNADALLTYHPLSFNMPEEKQKDKACQVPYDHRENKESNRYNEMSQKYGTGITIHGLSYVYTGKRSEKLFWTVIVLSALAMLGYGLSSLIERYLSYDVYQSRTIHHPLSMQFPSITVCSEKAIFDSITCYNRERVSDITGQIIPCLNSSTLPFLNLTSCKMPPRNLQYIWFLPATPPLNCHVKFKRILQGACITLNPYQQEWQKRPGKEGRLNYLMTYKWKDSNSILFTKDRLRVILHEAGEFPIFSTSTGETIELQNTGAHEIQISSKITYRRQPPPYTSAGHKCLDTKSPVQVMSHVDQFPCMKSCMINYQFETCGGINDLWMQQLPRSQRKFYKGNSSQQTQQCIQSKYTTDFLDWKHCPACPMPCSRTSYKLESIQLNDNSESFLQHIGVEVDLTNQTIFILDIWYKDLEYELVSESPKYPWFSFLAEFGGYLGLLTGCSAISIIEGIVFIFLTALAYILR